MERLPEYNDDQAFRCLEALEQDREAEEGSAGETNCSV